MKSDVSNLVVDATLERVRDIAAFVRLASSDAGLESNAAEDIELAVVEAANNIVLHGYGPNQSGLIYIRCAVDDRVFVVELVDDSPEPAAALTRAAAPQACSESGRGLSIMAACTDSIEYSRSGNQNHLRLIKDR